MTAVCQSSKYGYCKFGNCCDRKHFSDSCEMPGCSGFKCDKRHPRDCFFFRNYGYCKFGSYCSYKHPLSNEIKLVGEVKTLKLEIKTLETNMNLMKLEIETIKTNLESHNKADLSSNESVKENDKKEKEEENENGLLEERNDNIEIIKENINSGERKSEESSVKEVEEETLEDIMKEQSLEEIIRANSGLFCEMCPWGPAKTKKGLITHKRRKHSNIFSEKTS